MGKAIELSPSIVSAWASRASAALQTVKPKENLDGIFADCEEALKLDPGSALAMSVRGQIKSKQENHIEAIADCKEALRLEPPSLVQRRAGWNHAVSSRLWPAVEAELARELEEEIHPKGKTKKKPKSKAKAKAKEG